MVEVEPTVVPFFLEVITILEVVALSFFVVMFVEAFTLPIKERFPKANLWFLFYIAFAVGIAVGWFSELNLFTFAPGFAGTIGRILTAVTVGGGPTFIYDWLKKVINFKIPERE